MALIAGLIAEELVKDVIIPWWAVESIGAGSVIIGSGAGIIAS